ncbi:MAG: phycobilisome protein [Cyanobacteria bacterium P01_F01_bin.53]
MNGLSDRAKQLIPKARIVSFASWTDTSPEVIALFQAADDNSQYLTDEELASIVTSISGVEQSATAQAGQTSSTIDPIAVAKTLRDQASDIVDEARKVVLHAFPDILEPGGGLYPPMRADACWRDFWQFLRCITYGIAGGHQDYTSVDGLAAMEQLYRELRVPLPAMVEGLKGIKMASLRRFPADRHPALAPYFDHLISRLSAFVS